MPLQDNLEPDDQIIFYCVETCDQNMHFRQIANQHYLLLSDLIEPACDSDQEYISVLLLKYLT